MTRKYRANFVLRSCPKCGAQVRRRPLEDATCGGCLPVDKRPQSRSTGSLRTTSDPTNGEP